VVKEHVDAEVTPAALECIFYPWSAWVSSSRNCIR
jgi:hypothetical protein